MTFFFIVMILLSLFLSWICRQSICRFTLSNQQSNLKALKYPPFFICMSDQHVLTNVWVRIPFRRDIQHYVINFCQWLAAVRWFSLVTPVSSTNKTDCHDITEIFLKVALNTINQILNIHLFLLYVWSTWSVFYLSNFVLL